MNILIISDLHLTHRNFNEHKFKYLTQLIDKYDQLIINGDLWCSFTSTFSQFYNSEWRRLFKVLKRHHCIYIEGNHDLFKNSDDRALSFCDALVSSYVIRTRGHVIFCTHGHDFCFDWNKRKAEAFIRRLLNLEAIPLFIETFIIRVLGFKAFLKIYRSLGNSEQKRRLKKSGDSRLVVMGHTHAMESDVAHNYINIGRIGSHYASYLLINENGSRLMFEYY